MNIINLWGTFVMQQIALMINLPPLPDVHAMTIHARAAPQAVCPIDTYTAELVIDNSNQYNPYTRLNNVDKDINQPINITACKKKKKITTKSILILFNLEIYYLYKDIKSK